MTERTLLPRPMRHSFIGMSELVMPNDTNPHGTLSGGRLMHWVDVAGAMAAMRHARRRVVTVAFDEVAFHAPIPQGFMVLLEAIVTCVGRTSMEVRVKVHGEDPVTGEVSHTTTAHVVFVALDSGEPVEVPGLIPESPEEEALHQRAVERRVRRLKLRDESWRGDISDPSRVSLSAPLRRNRLLPGECRSDFEPPPAFGSMPEANHTPYGRYPCA